MSDNLDSDPRRIAGTDYLVDISRPLMDAGGGLRAFSASSSLTDTPPLMALLVDRHAPARPRLLQSLTAGIEGLLTPMAHGTGPPVDGRPGYYVICPAPPGPPISEGLRPWPEQALLELVMRPIALILDQFQARGMTHRSIRANNVFQAVPNAPVVLGAAWAAPPAAHQPVVYETAYTAICHPSARGDGRIADDVYALGVLLVTLAMGRPAMDGVDDTAIMFNKLEFGDLAAITGTARLPPILGDIVRGMLAEDPDHRPSPGLLRDQAGARGRRVTARPPPRAQRSFMFGGMTVWNNRTLALAMAMQPDEALRAIQSGTMMYWLRRGLGDSMLAVRLEELIRQHEVDQTTDKVTANSMLVMRAITDVDILMPLCWRGLAMLPDGLGPVLATRQEDDPELHRKLLEIVATEAAGTWAAMREERTPSATQRLEARQRRAILQIRGPAGGLPRLAYTLNPLTPCASKMLEEHWIANVRDLAPALDAIAGAAPGADLLEPRIAAFIGARSERLLDQAVKALGTQSDEAGRTLATLRLLTELQIRFHPAPLKGFTSWVTARARPVIERWRNREQRREIETTLKGLAEAGFLQPMLQLLEDQVTHARDSDELRAALAEMADLDAELHAIAKGDARRTAFAARTGQEIAAGIGLAAIATTLILAALN